jgi:oligoribonuclease (3'-5' exoribonuclease)
MFFFFNFYQNFLCVTLVFFADSEPKSIQNGKKKLKNLVDFNFNNHQRVGIAHAIKQDQNHCTLLSRLVKRLRK